jgi:hypothetical protein
MPVVFLRVGAEFPEHPVGAGIEPPELSDTVDACKDGED